MTLDKILYFSEKFGVFRLYACRNRRENKLLWRTLRQVWEISKNTLSCQLLEQKSGKVFLKSFD